MSDPFEGWAIVEDYPAYEVSDQGRVRRNGHILKPQPVPGGYLRVQLWRDGQPANKLVHILVAAVFIDERPDGREVNHKNGDKRNCAASNLEYLTRPDNLRHAYRTGLRQVTITQAVQARRKPRVLISCACSCGAAIETPDRKGRSRRFVAGHNARRAA